MELMGAAPPADAADREMFGGQYYLLAMID
jgi:hypothetical protein